MSEIQSAEVFVKQLYIRPKSEIIEAIRSRDKAIVGLGLSICTSLGFITNSCDYEAAEYRVLRELGGEQ